VTLEDEIPKPQQLGLGLDDGRAIYIDALTFGRARVSIGTKGCGFYDDSW
jgi:hypothetical protein